MSSIENEEILIGRMTETLRSFDESAMETCLDNNWNNYLSPRCDCDAIAINSYPLRLSTCLFNIISNKPSRNRDLLTIINQTQAVLHSIELWKCFEIQLKRIEEEWT